MAKTKHIEFGAIQIDEFDPKYGKMFYWDFYYDENDDLYDKAYAKEVKACDPKTVVLSPNKTYTLVIDYPTSVPYKAKIKTGKKGMTRIELADKVCQHYRKMYAEEDSSTQIPPLLGCQGGAAPMLNRQQTDGKYGIWGHEIEDLVLVNANIDAKGNITLGVDS